MSRTRTLSIFVLAIGVLALFAGPVAATEPGLDHTSFPATGDHDTLLHILEPGRYSIQAHSEQGTQVELVDRMAGPIHWAGSPGSEDGRLDVLLDTGTYKIRLHSDAKGTGTVTLAALPFDEAQPVQQAEDLPLLHNLTLESAELDDLQQRSYWIYLKSRQVLRFEAIGRNLKDCRLWLNGDWLVNAQPDISQYETVSGQPMTYAEFYHDLNPGLYRLTCYGGTALAWANDDESHPFHLRMGIPYIGEDGQRPLTISPFGRDAFLIDGDTNFIELSRQDKKPTTLQLGIFDPQGSRRGAAQQAEITKESREASCILEPGGVSGSRLMTVQAAPGDTLLLNYFVQREQHNFSDTSPRRYWVSNQFSLSARDAIDATPILAHYWPHSRRVSLERSGALELGSEQPIARKINLLGRVEFIVNVQDEGTYTVVEDESAGAAGMYQFEPLLFYYPDDYQAPDFVPAGQPIELTRDYYILTIEPGSKGARLTSPTSKGILNFTILNSRALLHISTLFAATESANERLLRQRVLWPQLTLQARDHYTLLLNTRHDVAAGLIVRALPLNLDDPLPVWLAPDEQVSIEARVKEASRLMVENNTDTPFSLSGYSEPIASGSRIAPGTYTFALTNTGDAMTLFTVKTLPAEVRPDITQGEIAGMLNSVEEFPVLTAARPLFRDFDRTEQQHFTLLVDEPGLYRVETSGRLATSINVRNRFNPSLFFAEQNGIGRNAVVQQYLKPGTYQISVQTQGRSRGRMGIHLRNAPLFEEGGLRVGVPKKIRLRPDEAVRYRFSVDAAGEYRLHTLGLNKAFAWRLEDGEGWPLLKPNQQGVIVEEFQAGSYYYYSLPDTVESRRITLLEPVEPDVRKLEGKGPHPLAFNQQIEHRWREAAGRPPDVYVLNVPDPVQATVHLQKDLEAGMYACASDDPNVCADEIALIRGGKARTFQELAPGRYEIRVKSIEENDQLPYTLLVETDYLITDLRYRIASLPERLTVSVGDDQLVELFSMGEVDVKAELWQDDRLVAVHDDMRNDWNFRISQKLRPGLYQLRLQQVGENAFDTFEVGMIKRPDIETAAQSCPFALPYQLQQEVLRVPFRTAAQEQLTRLHSSGPGLVKIALFQGDKFLADAEKELFLALRGNTDYTAFFWRLDQAEGAMSLYADSIPTETVDLSAQTEIRPEFFQPMRAYQLTNARNISYTFTGHQESLLFAPALEQPFVPVSDMPVVMPEASGWLVWKPARPEPQRYVLNACPTLAIRENADAAASLAATAFCGTSVDIFEQRPDAQQSNLFWYRVQLQDGTQGWVSAERPEAIFQRDSVNGIVATQVSPLRIRRGPALDQDVLDLAEKGERLTILGGNGDWYQVRLQNGLSGYAHGDYIRPEPRAAAYAFTPEISVSPFSLGEAERMAVEIGDVPLPFDFEETEDAPTLLEITSTGATLGAMAYSTSLQAEGFNWTGMWMEPSRTLMAVPGAGAFRGTIWPTSDATIQGKVLIRRRTFPLESASEFGDGLRKDGQLPPGKAQRIDLEPGINDLDALLTEGLVAFIWKDGRAEAIAAALDGNLQQRLTTGGGSLFVLNTGVEPGLFRLDKKGASQVSVSAFDSQQGFEHHFTMPGTLRLRIDHPQTALVVAGDQVSSRFFTEDGRILEGRPLQTLHTGVLRIYPAVSGLLELTYAPGYARVWQSPEQEPYQQFFGAIADIKPNALTHDAGSLSRQIQGWQFTVTEPTYIIAEADAPGITTLTAGQQVLAASAGSQPQGRQLEVFLEPGTYQLWTRPLQGMEQYGALRLHRIAPVSLDDQLDEQLWLIRPDETQVFQFQVTTQAKVGVGVRTESDRLQARLFDQDFHLLADGPLMFTELPEGSYILAVRVADDTPSPVQYRPVVHGQHGSLQGIPDDVMKEYQALENQQ